jgi:hypothetical protein
MLGLAEAPCGDSEEVGAAAAAPSHAAIAVTAARRMSIDPTRVDVVRIVIVRPVGSCVGSAPIRSRNGQDR